jgi:hypothetical protein
MSFFTKKVDTTFVLKGINPSSLDRNYGLNEIQKTIEKNEKTEKKNTLNIPENISFGKRKNQPEKNMKNITTQLESLGISSVPKEVLRTMVPSNTTTKVKMVTTFEKDTDLRKIKCFHCKHFVPEDALPLSLPLKYHPITKVSVVRHPSLLNAKKEKNAENENLILYREMYTKKQSEKIKNKENVTEEYFDCEGIFCSFDCMKAYCNEVSINYIKYRESSMLLFSMYKKFFGKIPHKLQPAPSWKLLKEFGGNLTIEEFRKGFQTVNYHDNNRYLIRIVPQLFEQMSIV